MLPRAEGDLLDIADWIAAHLAGHAEAWLDEMQIAIRSLGHMPLRCPVAEESKECGVEVRQLVRGSYRVLFPVHRARVEVLHVRHAARRPGPD